MWSPMTSSNSGAVSVVLLGEAARRVLAEGMGGRVMAVFRRGFYVADDAGGLACVGPVSFGPGPLHALCDLAADCDWQGRGLTAGTGASVENGILRVGGRWRFSLRRADRWRPPPPASGWTAMDLQRGLDSLAANSIRWRGSAEETPAWSRSLFRATSDGAAALRRWLVSRLDGEESDAPVPPAAASLIGLGPGLTPAGDDFLGGVLIALHALGREDVARRLAAWVLPRAGIGTNAISAAHLAAAADGHGAAALHHAIAALCSGECADLGTIDAIGHSSGWDALSGIAAACQAFLEASFDRPGAAARSPFFPATEATIPC